MHSKTLAYMIQSTAELYLLLQPAQVQWIVEIFKIQFEIFQLMYIT